MEIIRGRSDIPACLDHLVRAWRLSGDIRMATYTVVPAVDRTGFHVAIQGSDGIRQTILGFETSVEAEAWIEHDRRLSAVQAPWDPTDSRIPIALPTLIGRTATGHEMSAW
jgi:hypothetical protein